MGGDIQGAIEQAVVEILAERRRALGISAQELGRRVFPDYGNARMKVLSLTQRQGNGKPRGLRVGEFVELCRALALNPLDALARGMFRAGAAGGLNDMASGAGGRDDCMDDCMDGGMDNAAPESPPLAGAAGRDNAGRDNAGMDSGRLDAEERQGRRGYAYPAREARQALKGQGGAADNGIDNGAGNGMDDGAGADNGAGAAADNIQHKGGRQVDEHMAVDIERRALAALLKARKERGMSETELGRLAFPGAENPRVKVSTMYHSKTASNQNLRVRLGDFCAMCEALELDAAEIVARLIKESKTVNHK